jgi:hypothetical protein
MENDKSKIRKIIKTTLKEFLNEQQEQLPTQINIDAELDEIRNIQKLFHNKAETISSKTYNILIDELTEVEDRIKNKLEPIILKYCKKGDYEGAKWFVGKSYKDVSSSGKVLLFRSILVHQEQNS